MLDEDHVRTASHGSSDKAKQYRADQAALVEQGKFKEALDMDIKDIRDKFPDGRYETALKQAERYAETIPAEKLQPLPRTTNRPGKK